MKKWRVSDIRWATTGDLNLPFWQKWNDNNPLPDGFWQRIWEYPYAASKIPKSATSLDIGGTYPFVLFKTFPNTISVDNRDLNRIDHPLHLGKWPKDKLIISDAAKIPVTDNSFDYTFSISSIEEMPHTFEVLKEMIRIAKYRVVVTLDVSDILGVPIKKLRVFEEFLGKQIPRLPIDALTSVSDALNIYGQSERKEFKHIRVLAFTIDSRDEPKSVAILIPHWNSWPFLKLSLEGIEKNKNKILNEKIYVLDDSSDDGSFEKAKKTFKHNRNIEFHRFERPDKKYTANVGLLLDYGLKLVKEQFVTMIDADVFPIDPNWIAFPLWLVEKYGCSSVGLDTGLSESYKKIFNRNWWQPDEGYWQYAGLYDNDWFTCTNNLYRVMTSAMAKVVSESIGFTRYSKNYKLKRNLFDKFKYGLQKYGSKLNIYRDTRYPYLPEGCDNGVAANHFLDINYFGPKYNIPLTSYIGFSPKDGVFGMNVCGLIFHFSMSTRALSIERREVPDAGKAYYYWVKKVQNAESLDMQIINKMISASRRFQPGKYDGSIPASRYEEEYNYIQKLLMQYKKELKK